MEDPKVTGISHQEGLAKLTLIGVQDAPGVAARVFSPLKAKKIRVYGIAQTMSADEKTTDMTLMIAEGDLSEVLREYKNESDALGIREVKSSGGRALISVVGHGVFEDAEIPHTIFQTLAGHGINIDVITTSSIRLSVLIDASHVPQALKALHSALLG